MAARLHTPAAMRVLLVTPTIALRAAIAESLAPHATVDACAGFDAARARLLAGRYDLLVTALRLREYNGLQLVYLANTFQLPTRTIVFDGDFDVHLAAQAQAAGAFFEHAERVAVAAPQYLGATLPARDRRDPVRFDRRVMPRGGRRAADVAICAQGMTT